MLPRWKIKEVKEMDELGYGIIKCEDEQHALRMKEQLKAEKKCAQAGYCHKDDDKNNPRVYFVLTKERAH